MASQEGRTGAGAGSPLGPDSTWGEAEFSASKMEARFVQLEEKLLKDQNEKYNKLMEAIQGHDSNSESPRVHSDQVGTKISELQDIIEQKCLPCIEKIGPVMGIIEKSVDLAKTMEEMKSKIEMLLGGENEANKLIDSIAPNVEKVKADMKKLEQSHKEVTHKIDKVYDEAKKVRDEQKNDHKMLEDIHHLSKRIREEQTDKYKRMETKLEELKNSSKRSVTNERKRGRSGSDSSGNGSRNRHSRSRSRKRRASRENSISSLQAITRNKEHEFEKLLMQINGSLELQRESIEKLNNGSLNVLEEQIMPNIHTIRKLVEAGNIGPVTIPTSKWEDDDRSPSPPHRTVRSPHKLANKLGLDPVTRGREEKGRRKKKSKSASRSSSSSSEDRSSSRSGKKDIKRNMQVMVTTVAGIEEKVKELMKGNKKSNAKVEENSKQVLDRVGEMTVGVQVIAENLDSVNDVARKMEILDHIETSLAKLGRLDEISQIRVVLEKLRSDREETGWGEPSRNNRGIGHDEVKELVKEMDIDRKFCEFGGLVEELSSKIDKKLDRVSGDRDKESDEIIEMLKRLKRLETLSGAQADNSLKTFKTVQSLEKRSGGELLPALQELLRIGGASAGLTQAPPHSPAGSFTPPHPPSSVTDSPVGGGGGALSDYRMSQLDRKIGEILPKLDDMYIKVLPCLDEIKQRQRKESEKENLTVNEVKDCAEKVDKIMDMVEDLVEARNDRGPGSLDRRINSSMELEGVMNKFGVVEGLISRQQSTVGECLNALVEMRTFTAKQGTLDRIERLIVQRDEAPLTGVPGEDSGRLDRKITTALEFLKKEEKTLEMFMKNSMSDAKLLSQCNTSIQGMKAAVSGNGKEVLLAVQAVGDQLKGMEGLVGDVKDDLVGLGGSLDEIGGQVRSMDRDSSTACSGAEVASKLQTSLERLTSNVKTLEKASRSGVSTSSSVKQEIDTKPVGDDLGGNYSDLKSQLDDLHDMVAQSEETLTTGLTGVKQEVNKHDQNIGFAVNNLAKLLKAAVDSFKKLSGDLAETENRIKKGCEEATTEMLEHVDSSTEKIIKEAIESTKDNSSTSDGAAPEVGAKLDTVVNKLDKLSKIVGRIKYLVEDESDDEDESKKKKRAGGGGEIVKMDTAEIEKQLLDVSRKIDLTGLESRLEVLGDKMDKMDKDTSEKKVEELILKFDQLEDNISRRIEDDLAANSEKVDKTKQLVIEIKNVVTEVGDRMVTKRGFESGQEDVRQRLTKMASGIDSIPDEFGSQAAAMEENLCVNVVGSVKDVFKQHWDDLMNEVDQILGKLATIKRYVKFGVKEGQEEGEEGEQTTLETVMDKINKVAEKLSHVQAALETDVVGGDGVEAAGPVVGSPREKLGTALLLTEIRKRADSESVARLRQEMFTAVHNVQRRLLEEQVRLVTKLGESRQEAPQANIITLIECLNKVRESQAHISAGQESGILAQAETNKLLGVVVNSLDQAHNLLDSDSDGSLPQRITSRLAEICDDLAAAVTGLVTAQDQMGSCGTGNMEQLDRLIKSASNIMREDTLISATGRKRLSASEGGPVGKKRGVVGGIRSLRRDVVEESGSIGSGAASSSPMSEAGGGDGEPSENDWDPPVLRQPSVLVRQAVLTPRQRAELRKFSKDEEKDEKDNVVNEIEIKDEFASPEKGEGGSRTRTDRV